MDPTGGIIAREIRVLVSLCLVINVTSYIFFFLFQEAKEISVTQVNTFTKPVVLKCKEVSTFMKNWGRGLFLQI